ncbi:NUDIX domain-containing protein [Williamsia deligens]|uniref:NUDIX domain-containing protein n=1 Tax=Williamsia deligens TaxID=321325 RepID=A0ABW3GBE0_9NOCA|nr:NUDIX hydrolase [Williamsia deligens]MCP2196130.1 ADP-ribose pyrophosphatase [Williamsia deligens]
MTDGPHDYRVVDSRTVYDGAILALRVDEVTMPGGGTAKREIVEHHGAVAIVAVDNWGRIATVTQYRHAVQRPLRELPAGLMDSGGDETPVQAAARELVEEVGVEAESWHSLVDVASSPGFTDEALRVFLAQDLTSVDRPEAHDEEADMEIEWVALDDAVAMVFSGEIVNVTSVSGILAYAHALSAEIELRRPDAPWADQPTALDRRHG